MVVGAWGWGYRHLGGVAVRVEHLWHRHPPAVGVSRRDLHRDLHPPVQQHVECAAHVALLVEGVARLEVHRLQPGLQRVELVGRLLAEEGPRRQRVEHHLPMKMAGDGRGWQGMAGDMAGDMAGGGSHLPAERGAHHRAHQELGLGAVGELVARDREHATLGPCADAAVTHLQKRVEGRGSPEVQRCRGAGVQRCRGAAAAVAHHVRHDGAVPEGGASPLHGHAQLGPRAHHAHLPLEHHRQHGAARALAAQARVARVVPHAACPQQCAQRGVVQTGEQRRLPQRQQQLLVPRQTWRFRRQQLACSGAAVHCRGRAGSGGVHRRQGAEGGAAAHSRAACLRRVGRGSIARLPAGSKAAPPRRVRRRGRAVAVRAKGGGCIPGENCPPLPACAKRSGSRET
jgi:hypothetical protein